MKPARHYFSPVVSLAALSLACAAPALRSAPAPATVPPARQQPVPDSLDLKTAIAYALENNFAIRQARERIRQQDGVIVEVSSRTIPNVGASATYQLNDKEISQSFPASDPPANY